LPFGLLDQGFQPGVSAPFEVSDANPGVRLVPGK